MKEVTIDLVTIRKNDSFCLRLIEQGPLFDDLDTRLRRIQSRLYDVLELVDSSQFVDRFPDSSGKQLVVVLECLGLPYAEVQEFFHRFVSFVQSSLDWSELAKSIDFEIKELKDEAGKS